jgi:hypothetical protein
MVEYERDAVRFEAGRPVAAGDERLSSPTRIVQTSTGFWAVYPVGEAVLVVHPAGALRGSPSEVRDRLERMAADERAEQADQDAASSLLPFVGDQAAEPPDDDEAGRVLPGPRSRVELGVPPSYTLSDPTNTPGPDTGPDSPTVSTGEHDHLGRRGGVGGTEQER